MSDVAEPERVRGRADIDRLDGERVQAMGRYEAIPAPMKGPPDPSARRDHAVIVLEDDTWLFLEALGDSRATRSPGEIEELDGRAARAIGRLHRYMPAMGATLVAPCLIDLEAIGPAGVDPDGTDPEVADPDRFDFEEGGEDGA